MFFLKTGFSFFFEAGKKFARIKKGWGAGNNHGLFHSFHMGESISCTDKKNRLDFLKVTKKCQFFSQNDSDLALRLSTSISFHIYRRVRDEA